MAWEWNDPIEEGFDWADVGTLNKFVDACNERRAVMNQTLISTITAGQDVQLASLLSSFQNTMNVSRKGTASFWTVVWVDPVTPLYVPGESGTAAEAPNTGRLNTDRYNQIGLGEILWERRRPREFSSESATTDTQGNARADGQVAIISYPLGLNTTTKLMKRVAGAWVDAEPGDRPDVLSSLEAAPNRVTTSSFLNRVVQVGDYIGHWIFKQIRDELNRFVKIYVMAHGVGAVNGPSGNEYAGLAATVETGGGDVTTIATICTFIEGKYADALTAGVPASGSGDIPMDPGPGTMSGTWTVQSRNAGSLNFETTKPDVYNAIYGVMNIPYGTALWHDRAVIYKGPFEFTVGSDASAAQQLPVTSYDKKVSVYAYAVSPYPLVPSDLTISVFDANDLTVVEHEHVEIYSDATIPGADTTFPIQMPGDISVLPNKQSPLPEDSHTPTTVNELRGTSVRIYSIVDLGRPGMMQYTEHT